MSLQINGSNSLEQLAMQLSGDLRRQQNRVFQLQYIVTQTQGMNNWLKIKLAGSTGIVANCRFLKPNDLVSEISYLLNAGNRQSLSPATLPWVLFTLLAAKEFQDLFRKVANYYTNDDVKRLALAEKVADLFDQYQIYRPEIIRDWNTATTSYEGNTGWQKYLWVKAKELLGSEMPDKTVMGEQITEALQQPQQQQRLLAEMPNVHVFGLSIITAYHVHIFHELATVINVTFHLLNPAPAIYWFDDKSEKQLALWRKKSRLKLSATDLENQGNPLLTGWGKVLQETFSLFFESDAFLNQYNDLEAREPSTRSLLGKIQNDIFNNSGAKERNGIKESDLNDGSIVINACYTYAREVEVLYNYLVHLLDKGKEKLSARDIVVLVSDIDAYAPYIKAVFSSAPYHFPFTIADESFSVSDNLFSAIQAVLALNEDNFKAEEVLQLLDSAFIRERFSLTNIELIRRAVDAANIRFGVEGSKKDDTIYVSWKNGLRRIIYGICMSGGEQYQAGDYLTYPLDIAEGEDSFELIRFCHFAEVLIASIAERKYARTIAGWAAYIEQVVDNLICQAEDNDDENYRLLLQNLERLYALDEAVQDKISFEVFKHSFINSLSGETRSSAFAAGGITFCSLIPMRSIPFKVVALLGLSFDKFPRRETAVSFNLLEQDRRKGDRNVKENDKHLFLETILSAKKYFYLSYIGRSSKDNTVLPPSVLVDELIDYMQSGVSNAQISVKEALVTVHPLHGFSRKYLRNDSRLYTYLENVAAGSQNIVSGKTNTAELNFEEIAVDAFISFFKNPFKTYYNNVLQIRYEQDNVLLLENEVFEMDGLQSWQLKQDLLFIGDNDISDYRNKGVATGSLPLKNMAGRIIAEAETAVRPVKKMLGNIIGQAQKETLNIELLLDNTWLKGKLTDIYEGSLVFVSFSKQESRYLLEAYIRYLIAIAAGVPLDLYFVSAEKIKTYYVGERSRSRKSAVKTLQKLLNMYKQGHEEIFVFYPGFNKSPDQIAEMTYDKFPALISKAAETENCDPYLQKEYSFGLFNQPEVFEQYVSNSAEIFGEAAELLDQYYSR